MDRVVTKIAQKAMVVLVLHSPPTRDDGGVTLGVSSKALQVPLAEKLSGILASPQRVWDQCILGDPVGFSFDCVG